MQKNRMIKRLYFKLFEKSLISGAHFVHSLGKSEADGLNSISNKHNSICLPYGFKIDYKPESVMSKENFTFCFMGRLDLHTKGLDLLLEAFEQVVREYPNCRLQFIGNGSDANELKERVQSMHLNEHVFFLGAKYGEEKLQLLANADVFLHPSRNEGLPSSIMESSAMGTPSIVSEATNMGKYINEFNCGWVIANDSVSQLKDAMLKALNQDKEAADERGNNAIKMVNTSFSWKNVIRQMTQYYKQAIA